jgi:hypothetical protein
MLLAPNALLMFDCDCVSPPTWMAPGFPRSRSQLSELSGVVLQLSFIHTPRILNSRFQSQTYWSREHSVGLI